MGNSDASNNEIRIGGGTGLMNGATSIVLYTTSSNNAANATERMRIDSNGLITTAVTAIIRTGTGSLTTPSFAVQNDSNTGIYFPTGDTIGFVEGGAEAMRINSNGNVGIGTTSPGAALHIIAGSSTLPLIIDAPTSGYSYATFRYNTTAYGYIGQSSAIISGGSTTDFAIRAQNNLKFGISTAELLSLSSTTFTANTSTFTVNSGTITVGNDTSDVVGISGNTVYVNSGNVGINNTAPDVKLSVIGVNGLPATGGTTPNGVVRIKGTTNSAMFMGNDGSSPFSAWIQVQDVTGLATTYPLLLNPRGGSVGIGTTNPATKLDVNGTISIGGYAAVSGSATYTMLFRPDGGIGMYLGGSDAGNYYDNLTHYFRDRSSNTTMTVDASNIRVGIGTTSPAYPLQVRRSGGAGSLGVSVDSAGGITRAVQYYAIGDTTSVTTGHAFYVRNSSATDVLAVTIDNGSNIIAAGNVTGYGTPSDITFKENVTPINNALNTVLQWNGVHFDWKEGTKQHDMIGITHDVGFIAQEIQKVTPQLVREDTDGTLSLRERGIIPYLVEAIKEQQKQIDELKQLLGK